MGTRETMEKQVLKTFDEWTRHYAAYDTTALKGKVSDKLGVKEYAAQHGVATPKTLWSVDTPAELNGQAIPGNCVIKANNDSGGTMIFKNGKCIKGNFGRLIQHSQVPYGIQKEEWWYALIKPKYFCEEYLADNIKDYKLHCHNGEVMFTQIISDRLTGAKERIIMPDGTPTNWLLHHTRTQTDEYEVPAEYSQMVEIANRLSKPFSYVRVDLFIVDGTIYLGEMTFKPDGLRGSLGPNQMEIGALFNGQI